MSWRYLALLALLLAACGGDDPERAPAIGEAYVAPPVLNLRKEIDPRSPTTAAVKHGERLEIVGRRRVFFRVRTASGAEGWTSQRMLLNKEEMDQLRAVEDAAGRLPSQGAATVFDLLNAHLEPYRQSPTIFQLEEGDKMAVLAYEVSGRTSPPRKPLLPPPPRREPPPRKRKAEPKLPPPPKPPPPRLPPNWEELSKTPPLPEEEQPEKQSKRQRVPAPPLLDDWALVRTPDGRVGWVLVSRIYMSIPDEVAQYAEGRRITSYFSLGEVKDGDQTRHHWLWTTIENRHEPHDYDSFRVFIWNLRRHRYETAYIERNRIGYFPTLVKGQQFSVCLQKDDGQRYRRTYELQVNIVRFLHEKPCEPAPIYDSLRNLPEAPPQQPVQAPRSPGLLDKIRAWFR